MNPTVTLLLLAIHQGELFRIVVMIDPNIIPTNALQYCREVENHAFWQQCLPEDMRDAQIYELTQIHSVVSIGDHTPDKINIPSPYFFSPELLIQSLKKELSSRGVEVTLVKPSPRNGYIFEIESISHFQGNMQKRHNVVYSEEYFSPLHLRLESIVEAIATSIIDYHKRDINT